jgi:hypothetical protein
MHAYSYQGLVFPSGVALAWGPWPGNEPDSNKLRESGLLDDLADISSEHGRVYLAFGDAAYATHTHFEHIIPGHCGRHQKLLNALNQRFRITVSAACNIATRCAWHNVVVTASDMCAFPGGGGVVRLRITFVK